MRYKRLFIVSIILILALDGKCQRLVTYKSDFPFDKTYDLIIESIREKGLSIIDVVSYSDYDNYDGPSSKVISYENSYTVTLTECDQTVALDLPLKIIVWKEEEDVYIGYLNPLGLAKKYLLEDCKYALDWISKLNLRIINESLLKGKGSESEEQEPIAIEEADNQNEEEDNGGQ